MVLLGRQGRLDCVAAKEAVNLADETGRFPLHVALQLRHAPDVVSQLLGLGADVNAQDGAGRCALHIAATAVGAACIQEVVKLLLDAGANVSCVDAAQQSPAAAAIEAGNVSVLKCLTAAGAQVPLSGCRTQGEFIEQLVTSNQVRVLAALAACSGFDANVRCARWPSPAHAAAFYNHKESMLVLANHGADLTITDDIGATPLHVACAQGHADLAALLVKYHADTRRTDRFGCTPLHAAVRGGHAEVVEVLLEHNPPLEAQDTVGRNVLHVATLEAQSDAFDALLGTENEAVDWRAAMRQRMRDGRTPLDVCGGGERDGLEAMGTAMRQYIADRAESESEAAKKEKQHQRGRV